MQQSPAQRASNALDADISAKAAEAPLWIKERNMYPNFTFTIRGLASFLLPAYSVFACIGLLFMMLFLYAKTQQIGISFLRFLLLVGAMAAGVGIGSKALFALTSLELLDDNKTKNRLFSMLTGDAKFIVCCETTRAFIMRNWYGLKRLPYVMPNKPYDFQDERRKTPSIEATKKAIELVQDKKFIIYQGILKSRDYMLEMAKAIRDSGTGYYFVLMGLDPENIFADIKKEYEKSIFIKNIPAPYHLEVTSYAAIGFVFYDDRNSLNRAFCAPNKIYEYSGLRIPAIGNEVPGLVNTIGAAKAGVCVPMKKDALMRAIRDIEEHYDLYAKNAYEFYQGTDNEALMKRIIEENGIL